MKQDRAYLKHIQDAIAKIQQYTVDGKQEFMTDTKTQDSVIRNLEILGEAVKNLSNTLTKQYPGVPWKQIAGLRDKLIHQYFGVDFQLVWEAVEKDIPKFSAQINQILIAINK